MAIFACQDMYLFTVSVAFLRGVLDTTHILSETITEPVNVKKPEGIIAVVRLTGALVAI